MLKLKKGANEYEILGQITFRPNEESEDTQTNYTIILDGATTTIESTDTEWEVIDVPDPVVEEPEPTPEPEPEVIVPTEEELERGEWMKQWYVYVKANTAMKALAEAGFTPTEEETTRFTALKNWVGANRKPEYSQFI